MTGKVWEELEDGAQEGGWRVLGAAVGGTRVERGGGEEGGLI